MLKGSGAGEPCRIPTAFIKINSFQERESTGFETNKVEESFSDGQKVKQKMAILLQLNC